MLTTARLSRRALLKAGAAGTGLAALGGAMGGLQPLLSDPPITAALADSLYIEAFPTSPLILNPFNDPLPVPTALAPVPHEVYSGWKNPPGPGIGQQDSNGGTHQIWSSQLRLPDPVVYQIKVQVDAHSFTSSQVLPIGRDGRPTQSFGPNGRVYAAGTRRNLPPSTIYGFNSTFPGPRINVEYGKPVLVRFENHLDENPKDVDRQDYGSPEWGFVTHLHNGHTAPESDGNPNHAPRGYRPGQWVDNLYLNYPAGSDDKQKQSFFWFHDHYMDHTGANVYKGMVGIYPLYDSTQNLDVGDERQGWRLPGVRTNNPDGSFDVEYDVPLVFYDLRLDDGVTPHKDFHNGNGETHPEWWGQSFFRHFPNHGFVGDIFTVNGVAYPTLEVKRRKYRFRFLDASVSRIYDFKLMSSRGGPKSAVSLGYKDEELQGQYRLPDGQQCMRFTQIASDGGLLPRPIVRDSFELWPAKRREVIVDFTRYQDGSPTRKGEVIYLVNLAKMPDGRMPASPDPNYKVPVLKIVIGEDADDDSLVPQTLRPVADLPSPAELQSLINKRRVFKFERGSGGGELEWLINGQPFDPTVQMARPKRGTWEAWEFKNGGGGWVHPVHIHQEEHRVVLRNGKPVPDGRHPDDVSREDVVALDPGESVVFVRQFRTFTGKYVAHCHNLAHEDHAMMFGWEIVA